MAQRPEIGPRPTGLESKNREELEALWEEADNSSVGRARGFTQGQISEAIDRLNHREAFQNGLEPDQTLPASDLPFKDRLGNIQNFTILKMRREAAAAIRAKHPESFEKKDKK